MRPYISYDVKDRLEHVAGQFTNDPERASTEDLIVTLLDEIEDGNLVQLPEEEPEPEPERVIGTDEFMHNGTIYKKPKRRVRVSSDPFDNNMFGQLFTGGLFDD